MRRKPNHVLKQKVTAKQPQQTQALQHKLVEAHREHQAGRLKEAKQLCLEILEVDTRQPDCLNLLGVLQNQTGDYQGAASMFRRAIAVNDNIVHYHSNLGFALQALGKLSEATVEYKQAVLLKPDFADGLSDLGEILRQQEELEEARVPLEKALTLTPDHAAALNNLGAVERGLGELAQAAAHLKRALALKPDYVEALTNLGAVLWEQGELEEARVLLERALVLKPDYAGAHLNMGVVLEAQGQPKPALVHYERALALKPDLAQAHWNRSLIQLLLGDFAGGWCNYQWRCQIKKLAPRNFSQPLWRGEPLTGSRILLHTEQGLGDTLQFLRYLPLVCAAGGTVLLDVPANMRRVAEQLPGIAELTVTGEALQPFDWHCPLMGLPLAFGTALQTIPAQVPYLSIPEAAQQMAATVSWPEDGLRVGLVWSGSPTHKNDRHRSLPLALLAPLSSIESVHLFSLQLPPAAEQLASFPAALIDLAPAISDVADTASLLTHLDLVITVDTAVAHLAGALAKPVWVLLPFAPDWRWLLDREDSPWYPTMRLFRQTERNEWAPVVARVRADLAVLASGDRSVLEPRVLLEDAHDHANPGSALKAQGKLAEAVAGYKQAIAFKPDSVDALTSLGYTLREQGELEQARTYLEKALALKPDHVAALHNLGAVERRLGELDQAAAHLERALVLKPDGPEVLTSLARVLLEQGQLEQARVHLERALVLKPDFADAYLNLGVAFVAKGQPGNALVAFARAVALKPDLAEAHWNHSLVQLLLGDFAAGWHNYQWRYLVKEMAPRGFSQPLWRGEPLTGARILLHAEQGLGDTIQFLRYVPMVVAAGGTVLLDVPGSLRRLAEQLPGIAALTVSGEALQHFDWQCPLMGLPLAFGTTLKTIPAQVPYLHIPEEAQQTAAARAWPEQGVRVGLVWSGSPAHTNNRNRSLPLALLAPLFTIEGVLLFSLQVGPAAAQLEGFRASITDLAPAIDDMADTAAQIAHLDLVITVDTAVAHLAGALGKPVWVLLPFAADWRWLLEREDSPWYPTMRLFRQPERNEWAAAVGRVRAELATVAGGDRGVLTLPHPDSALPGASLQQKLTEAYREQQAGRIEEAKQLCLQILQVDTRQDECLNLLGVLQYKSGYFQGAANMFRRAIVVNDTIAHYRANLGLALQALGKTAEAIAEYKQAVTLKPDFADGLTALGGLLLKQGELGEARACLEKALALKPDHAIVLNNLGIVERRQGALDRAAAHLERALALKPDYPDALSNLGAVLWERGELEQARARLDRALVLKPDFADAYLNLGVIFAAQGQHNEALAHFERALDFAPDLARAHWNRSLLQLLVGDFAAGWRNYQWRYQLEALAPRMFSQPVWRGEPLTGARILLHSEQGLGDTIQCLRYLPLVVAAGAAVLLDVPASLRRICEQLPGIAELTVATGSLSAFDWHCPLMGLPLAFGTTFETIPAQVPYLSIPEAAQQTAAKLAWPEQGLRVGLVWSGSPAHKNDRNRSLSLVLLAPLFALESVHLFSLQLGPAAAQLAGFPEAIADLAPAIGDVADTAALIAHLDLVITVDTAVAHLAGALGKPVWVLVPFAPDWRWLLDREDSPWYPTMRLFRQPGRNDWPPVVARVRADLAALAAGDRGVLKPRVSPDGELPAFAAHLEVSG